MQKVYLYYMRTPGFLILFTLGLISGCASTSSSPIRRTPRDMSSTYERRASMEELRRQELHGNYYYGPVLVFPILHYRW